MKIRTVELSKDFRINLGNYESAMIRTGITADLGPDDDPEGVMDELSKMCDDRLDLEIDKLDQ